ncbi:MAG: HEAT repeat domain-containing protein [Desulfopila sp.]|jgi:hypothetical protein|nr:HEAT repeat domain-containing protein [Desulfopila sp.]
MNEVSDTELKKVIGDFLEMGYVDNIVSMFRKEPQYLDWTGELLQDERFNVRLGLTILFEELADLNPSLPARAVPSLKKLLKNKSALIRGEAIGILGIIGTKETLHLITEMKDDPSPQVRDMVALALEEST